MKRLIFKYTSLFAATVLAAVFTISCGVEEEPPTPIFTGTELIDVSYDTGSNTFYYNASDDVEYIILGIFSTPITTSGKTITNIGDMEGGSRTGLTGFVRTQTSTLYTFVSGSFTGSTYPTPGTTKYWAVWGFNKDWVIIESSNMVTQTVW